MRPVAWFGLVAAAVCLLPTCDERSTAKAADAKWSEDFSGDLDDWIVPLLNDWKQLDEDGDGFLRLTVDRLRSYHTHLSSDDGSHSFHSGSRYRLSRLDTWPALPSEEWRDVRVTRTCERMAVYVGDAEKALFTAQNPWFLFGRVGLGSLGETSDFDDFALSGAVSDACRADDLSPLDP